MIRLDILLECLLMEPLAGAHEGCVRPSIMMRRFKQNDAGKIGMRLREPVDPKKRLRSLDEHVHIVRVIDNQAVEVFQRVSESAHRTAYVAGYSTGPGAGGLQRLD